MARLIVGVGLGQIVSWGALIYAIAVLGGAMAEDLGVSTTLVFGAFSASLVISGLVGPRIGAAIDYAGGRRILSLGSLGAAVSLAALALAPNAASFVLAWLLIGCVRGMTLYEAAFATISQHAGPNFRTAVSAVTLFGGLAGTAAFPLSLLGLEAFGWRWTIAGFAAAELLVCLPLHLGCIPPGPGTRAATDDGGHAAHRGAPVARARPGFAALATSFALTGFVTSAIAVHVVSLLQATGMAISGAVAVASLIGPMQVTGRIAELTLGRRFPPVRIGVATQLVFLLALGLLAAGGGRPAVAVAFALLYGVANGVHTIVIGTVPAELYGRGGYGGMMGRLTQPALIARAIAPLVLAYVASSASGSALAVGVLIATVLGAFLAYLVAIRRVRHRA